MEPAAADLSNELGRRPMRKPRWIAVAAMPTALALALAGCGGDSGDGGGGGGAEQQAKNDAAEVSVYGTEPENPLVPGNTNEQGGSKVADAMFTGLVEYNAETYQPENANAEKIEMAPDATSMTVTLKKGWKFHDGTDVKAKNYVDAWNYTAYGPNAQQNASFLSPIAGFDQVHTEDPDGEGPQQAPTPATDKMSGLEIIDDYSFKVTFSSPHAIFPLKVGYLPYSPLPDAFFQDKAAFEANPIGNGPFKFVSRVPKQEIKITRYEEYQGTDRPKIKNVKFTFPEGLEAGYAQLKGNQLDFMDQMPPSALVGNIWKEELKDRSNVGPVLAIQALAFPLYDPKFANADFRKAISMAINRDEINQKIFEGTRPPVNGYAVPNTPGWEDGACGDLCKFNPDMAKEHLARSGWSGAVEITSNADGGHKEWIEAACGQIKNTLGIDCVFVPVQAFGEIRQKINARQMTQVYRAGWIADYPSIENFLNPLYRTGGSSNDGEYTNPQVDAKLAEADAAPNLDEANRLYREAEKMIAQDMPAIPLWHTPRNHGWSSKLKDVRLTAKGELDLTTVQIT
jgi:oligopeptide transport system substrate-binding protein